MKVERVKLSELREDPSNARKHSEQNIDSIITSLHRFGQQKPIVVNSEGVIVAGNGTYRAAKNLGWDEIDIVRTGLVGSEATAYAIADNRTAELAEWDVETLSALYQGLDEDLQKATGFDEKSMAAIMETSGNFVVEESTMPELKDGDRAPFRQVTFTLHDEQYEEVEAAIKKAKADGGGQSSVNENGNGNALAWICERFNRG